MRVIILPTGYRVTEEDARLFAGALRGYPLDEDYVHVQLGLCNYTRRVTGKGFDYLITQLRAMFDREPGTTYIGGVSGRTPERLLLARQMADYIEGRIAFLDNLGPKHIRRFPMGWEPRPSNISSATKQAVVDCVVKNFPPREPNPGTSLSRVLAALQQGNTTLASIASAANVSETGASARIRELRSQYGHPICTTKVRKGVWVYTLTEAA